MTLQAGNVHANFNVGLSDGATHRKPHQDILSSALKKGNVFDVAKNMVQYNPNVQAGGYRQ